jgi:L-aminopeptidase/D-esterase-like protein
MDALLAGVRPGAPLRAENTSIGVVATNVSLTKAEATKVAQMAHDGLARTIRPAHAPWDGDTLFALSTGTATVDQACFVVGALASEAVARAVLRAVTAASGLPGFPSVSDLAR